MASDLEERGTHGEEERKPERPARRRSRDSAALGARLVLAIILVGILGFGLWWVITPHDGRIAMLPTPTPTPKAVEATPRPTFTPRPSATKTPLPPPTASATPTTPPIITVGGYVKVTAGLQLRFRSGPGLKYVTWRILPEGEILKVTGGPREADGFRWWLLVDKQGIIGWAVENWLAPTAPPAWTPLPERTPSLEVTATPQG
ncbi:MAG TPA: hypothetical protein EYP55_07895 [Anaerolineae bacterium]|nr:hypothetical protein [Anaerolineae bacterium]